MSNKKEENNKNNTLNEKEELIKELKKHKTKGRILSIFLAVLLTISVLLYMSGGHNILNYIYNQNTENSETVKVDNNNILNSDTKNNDIKNNSINKENKTENSKENNIENIEEFLLEHGEKTAKNIIENNEYNIKNETFKVKVMAIQIKEKLEEIKPIYLISVYTDIVNKENNELIGQSEFNMKLLLEKNNLIVLNRKEIYNALIDEVLYRYYYYAYSKETGGKINSKGNPTRIHITEDENYRYYKYESDFYKTIIYIINKPIDVNNTAINITIKTN